MYHPFSFVCYWCCFYKPGEWRLLVPLWRCQIILWGRYCCVKTQTIYFLTHAALSCSSELDHPYIYIYIYTLYFKGGHVCTICLVNTTNVCQKLCIGACCVYTGTHGWSYCWGVAMATPGTCVLSCSFFHSTCMPLLANDLATPSHIKRHWRMAQKS